MLSDMFLIKAREELREDDKRKQQALEHFREWIHKHPFIKQIRQDDIFLLQFLRTKKYMMDRVFKTFECAILNTKRYSKWFDISEEDHEKMLQLFERGYIYPLAERDEQGRRIMLIQLNRLDPDYFTSADAIRLSIIISASILEEEETQIAGFATIINHEGVTMKQTSMFSVTDIVDFSKCLQNSVGRYKQLFLVNLPSFAMFLVDVAKTALNEKLKKRMVIAKDMTDLHNYIDPKILPKEYGGEIPEAEHMEIHRVYFRTVRPMLEKIKHDRIIDWNRVPGMNEKATESVGSFRKLEID